MAAQKMSGFSHWRKTPWVNFITRRTSDSAALVQSVNILRFDLLFSNFISIEKYHSCWWIFKYVLSVCRSQWHI